MVEICIFSMIFPLRKKKSAKDTKQKRKRWGQIVNGTTIGTTTTSIATVKRQTAHIATAAAAKVITAIVIAAPTTSVGPTAATSTTTGSVKGTRTGVTPAETPLRRACKRTKTGCP